MLPATPLASFFRGAEEEWCGSRCHSRLCKRKDRQAPMSSNALDVALRIKA